MMSRLAGLAGLLATLGLVLACDVQVGKNGVSVDVGHGNASDEWKRTYSLKPGGRLDIVNVSGEITVLASDGPVVEVVATRDVRVAGTDEQAQEALQKSQIVEQVSPVRVSIESRLDRRNGVGQRVNVAFTVRIPAGLTASMKTESGGLRLDRVDGVLTAQTTNGPIVGRDLSGSVNASTVNGGIRIEIAKLTGDSRIVAVNGPIELALAPDVNATLEASVVNGVVLVADGMPLTTTDKSPQHVAGTINRGGPTIYANTTNGAVRVKSGKLDVYESGRGRRGRRGPPPPS
jgi:putative adhesin